MAKVRPRTSGELDVKIEDHVGFPAGEPMTATYADNGTAVDVTGWTAKFEVRDIIGDTSDPLLSLTDGSGITVGTTDGLFTIVITAAQAIFGDREMQYAFVVNDGTSDYVLLRGKFTSYAMVLD